MVLAATVEAGQSRSGSSTRVSKPSRAAANVSMRPSWPPPSTPMVDPGRSGNSAKTQASGPGEGRDHGGGFRGQGAEYRRRLLRGNGRLVHLTQAVQSGPNS